MGKKMTNRRRKDATKKMNKSYKHIRRSIKNIKRISKNKNKGKTYKNRFIGGQRYGTGVGSNCYDPNFSIFNTNLLKLFPYKAT